MGEPVQKRKGTFDAANGQARKKSKGGSAGRWKTPFQRQKEVARIEMGQSLEIGNQGLWVTCARGMNSKAMAESLKLLEEYAEIMYGIKPEEDPEDAGRGDDDNDKDGEKEEEDIAAAISNELANMKDRTKTTKDGSRRSPYFTPIKSSLDCVFFVKTVAPIEPDRMALRICEDVSRSTDIMKRKCKYVNRLTPVLDTDKATENGIEKVGRRVLGGSFELKEAEVGETAAAGESDKLVESRPKTDKRETYAIRITTRNHKSFRSTEIIQRIAGLIHPDHKVDLTNPDKVIIVEVFQLFCGLCVVDGKQWEDMKRYNINELYRLAAATNEDEGGGGGEEAEAEKGVTGK